MDAKFVVFVFLSTFIVAAIYSSSLIVVHAAKDYCTHIVNNQYTCFSAAGGSATVSVCTVGKVHDTCHQYEAGKIATKLPPGAKDALDAASEQTQNTTKVPITDFLKDNGILQGNNNDNTENNTSNDNVKEPKAPEDLGGLNDNGQ
jgi:hypothetical protein